MSESLLEAKTGETPKPAGNDPLADFRRGPGGEIDTEALAAAYVDLAEKAASRIALPGPDMADDERHRLYRALGVPESPDGYEVTLSHSLFERDPAIEKTLHAAGFSTRQVQVVYDLAAERMLPLIEDIAGEMKAEQDIQRLATDFGGEDRWQEVSRQLLKWGRKNLPADVLENLTTSYEGVMALHRMMSGEEKPGSILTSGDEAGEEDDLDRMIRDPKYWKDKDPAFIRKVTEGFKRLYPEG